MAMLLSPCRAKGGQFLRDPALDAAQFRKLEAIALSQLRRSARTIQQEYGFSPGASDMDMRGTVIIGVDHHAQASEAQEGRHGAS